VLIPEVFLYEEIAVCGRIRK
jgi:hypothetical protein